MIRFTRIVARDCFAYEYLDFTFDTGLHSIQGINGAAKTSIFLTLMQGLFNRNAKETKVDEVNNSITQEPYEVEIEFTEGKDSYKVINSRKSGKIEIYKNNKAIHLKRIPDNLKLIQEILGCDYETFRDLIYQSPKSSINLLETSSDIERKKFINRVLRLDELDFHLDRMKAKEKELSGKNGRIELLTKQVESLRGSFGEELEVGEEQPAITIEADLEVAKVYKEQVALNNQETKQKLSEATAAQLKAEAIQKDVAKRAALREELADLEIPSISLKDAVNIDQRTSAELTEVTVAYSKAADMHNRAVKADEAKQLRDKLGDQLEALPMPAHDQEFCKTNLNKLNGLMGTTDANRAAFIAERNKLAKSGGKCPTCGHEVDADQFESEIAELDNKIEEATQLVDKCSASLTKYTDMERIWRQRNTITSELDRLSGNSDTELVKETLWAEVNELMEKENVLRARLAANTESIKLHRQYQDISNNIDVLNAYLNGVDTETDYAELINQLSGEVASYSGEYTKASLEIQRLEAELAKINNHNASVRSRRELNQQIKANNQKLQLELDNAQKELKEAEERLELIKIWVGILGGKGYRVHKIGKFLHQLNQTLNKYALMLADGRIKCTFFLSEGEIDFTVTDAAKAVPFANWSAGEQSRIKLACLFAVLELLEVIGSISFNVLCLDEIFSALDSDGREGLFRVLEYLKGRNKCIYTIAHSELALPKVYDSIITATKGADGICEVQQ